MRKRRRNAFKLLLLVTWRLLIVFSIWNVIVGFISSQPPIRRFGIRLMVDGYKYRIERGIKCVVRGIAKL